MVKKQYDMVLDSGIGTAYYQLMNNGNVQLKHFYTFKCSDKVSELEIFANKGEYIWIFKNLDEFQTYTQYEIRYFEHD